MDYHDYIQIGLWFALPTAIIIWLGCIIYAVTTYGWFLGIPLGVVIGGFFAYISAFIIMFIWPVIALGLFLLIYAVFA